MNTAARLEANAPGGKILISGAVREALGERARVSVPETEITLKGKKKKMDIFILEGLDEARDEGY